MTQNSYISIQNSRVSQLHLCEGNRIQSSSSVIVAEKLHTERQNELHTNYQSQNQPQLRSTNPKIETNRIRDFTSFSVPERRPLCKQNPQTRTGKNRSQPQDFNSVKLKSLKAVAAPTRGSTAASDCSGSSADCPRRGASSGPCETASWRV